MKFRLTYEGELRPTQRDALERETDKLASHKQAIRRVFHRQLKQLWQEDKFLRECEVDSALYTPSRALRDVGTAYYGSNASKRIPLVEAVAGQHHALGYRFVPLVLDRWSLLCSLNILFLRRDMPGSVLHAGDIDNRIKTLIDALRPPQSQNELVEDDNIPKEGEDPFFCLLEDDRQVSHFSVETDRLLDPPTPDGAEKRKAHLVITVEIRPYYATMFNSSFLG
jgi:hypothetical protein